ncbi:MAG: DUF2207 domain-containing protein [Candidatus Gracilibacteria bacterium]|jgi:uncharacterized membrane protein
MKLTKKIAAGIILILTITLISALHIGSTNITKAQDSTSFDDFSSDVTSPDSTNDWSITNFDADIQVQKDGSVLVDETITTDFPPESEHHGIFRFIPINYKDDFGNNVSIKLKVLSIQDTKGNEWPYETSYSGQNITLKIGDPDKIIHGQNIYKITYQVDRALLFLKDHDELYWNITGDQWETDIQKASATITVPAEIQQKDLKADCYTGAYGSTDKKCDLKIQDNTTTVTSTTDFKYGEGLTVAVAFPKGIIKEPTAQEKITWFLADNWGYFLPVIAFIALFSLWFTRGRDPKEGVKTTIMPYYEAPDNLTPSEIGTLVDEKADMQDITSTIIDMAVRGYLKIIEIQEKKIIFNKTDYELELQQEFENDNKVQEHEKAVLRAIFDASNNSKGAKVKLSTLANKFYMFIPGIKKNIYELTVSKGYFPVNPDNVRKIYLGVGIGLIVLGFFSFMYFSNGGSVSVPIGLVLSGLIIIIFSNFMPIKTKKGVEIYYKIKGLKEFINTAEADRLKFQEKENLFEKLLPYAMALGIAEKWSKAFEGIYKNPPSWYQSSNPNFMNNFSTYYFVHSLNSFSNTMQQTLASTPKSSGGIGGGFSGGGFGGGGGGAW